MSWFTRRGLEVVPSDLTYPGWISEMKQANLNLLVIHTPEDIANLEEYAQSEGYATLSKEAAAAGIDIEWAPHAFRDLLPREEFGGHPEWFRMSLLGVRTPDWNLCPTNQQALEIVAENASKLASRLVPTTHRYYFWADDGRPWCHCPACAGLAPSDQSMLVTNAILQGIRTVDPQAQLSGIAYYNTLEPLQQTKPADGIFLEYAPIQRCFLHALDDESCAVNRAELGKLRGLLPSYPNRQDAQVLEYWLDESLFWRTAGRPEKLPRLPFSADVLERDLQLYADLGFRSVVTYAVMLGNEYRALYGEPPLRQYGEALAKVNGPRSR